MRTTTPRKIALGTLLATIASFTAAPMRAQNGYEGDEYAQGDIQQTVARISYVDGNDASYSRGDDPDAWEAAVVNVPLTLGDRVYTGDGSRMELQVHGGTFVRLAPRTDLTALNLTDDVKQLSLASGTGSFRVRRLRNDEVFEVDTPNVAVTFDTPGNYRVDVAGNGDSRVVVRSGHVTVSAAGGEIPVSSGNEISIQGFDNPSYDVYRLGSIDSWDRWVGVRDSRFRRVGSYQYVNADVVGVEDLDRYGHWQDVPQYGHCWTPSSVQAGWTPYRDGQWIWQDPWGWTWVGAEPWGWAPYHYGRWVTYSSRWFWVPAGPRVAARYSPALVAFVGGGPGWSMSFAVGGGGGYVGWFPLAPRDPFIPWWGSRRDRNVNVTNVTYVNRTYVTVVNQNTFVSGAPVQRNYVRDPQVIRRVETAPVARGPIPVVPTTASLRVAAATARLAPRPPAVVERRAVVTRVAPPPAPASFQTKVRVIQENRGAPIAPRAEAQMSIQARGERAPRLPCVPRPRPKAVGWDSRRAAPTPPSGPPRSPRREARRSRPGIGRSSPTRPPSTPGKPRLRHGSRRARSRAPRLRAAEFRRARSAGPLRRRPRRRIGSPPSKLRRRRHGKRLRPAPRPGPRRPRNGPRRRGARSKKNAVRTRLLPKSRRLRAPSPGVSLLRPRPPGKNAAPPGHEREQPAPPPARHPAPPPAAKSQPAPRAQPPEKGKGNDKNKEKDKKKKEEPPPPPPSL